MHDADDILTGIRLNKKGFKGVYVPEVLAIGLAPNTWEAYINQQRRWARSVFNLMVYHFPKFFLKGSWKQVINYYALGSFYFVGMAYSLLLFLPVISILTNNALANAKLISFIFKYFPCFLLQYIILIGFGRQFLIKNGSKGGYWIRAGLLWIGSWYHFVWAFFSAIRTKKVEDREITPKAREKENSLARYYIPHLFIVIISTLALIYSFLNPGGIEETNGMQLFLILNIISQGMVLLFSFEKKVA